MTLEEQQRIDGNQGKRALLYNNERYTIMFSRLYQATLPMIAVH
jgi:hypothetical protein